MRIVIHPTFPGRRRNSPRAEALCSDLPVGPVPAWLGLFVADEAGITITVDGGRPHHVRAMLPLDADSEFDKRVHLVATVDGLGTIELDHVMNLDDTVAAAISVVTVAIAVRLADAAIDAGQSAELVVLDHRGDVFTSTTL